MAPIPQWLWFWHYPLPIYPSREEIRERTAEMTLPLTHPVVAQGQVAAHTVEAALASLSYWTAPSLPKDQPAPQIDLSPLEQMFAYFD